MQKSHHEARQHHLLGSGWPQSRYAHTRHAEAYFSGLGCRTEFISFTSFDRFDSDCVRKPHSFFHLAGQSPLKGTSVIVNLWLKHPEWPRLTIVQHPDHAQPIEAENIRYIVASWMMPLCADTKMSRVSIFALQKPRGLVTTSVRR